MTDIELIPQDDAWKIKDEKLRALHYAAYATNRQLATAGWLSENPNAYAYIYNRYDAVDGLDPWTRIAGIDVSRINGDIILEYGQYSEKIVTPDYIVFVQ